MLKEWEEEREKAHKKWEQEYRAKKDDLELIRAVILRKEGATSAELVSPTIELADHIGFRDANKAKRLYAEAIEIIEAQTPVDSKRLIAALSRLAELEMRALDHRQALIKLEKAERIVEGSEIVEGDLVTGVYSLLSECQEKVGAYKAALDSMLAWSKKCEAAGVRKRAFDIKRLAKLQMRLDLAEDALATLENGLCNGLFIYRWETTALLEQLVDVCRRMGRLDAEESYLKEVWKTNADEFGAWHERTTKAAAELRRFYERTGMVTPKGIAQSIPIFVVSNRNWQMPHREWAASGKTYRAHYGRLKFHLPWSEVTKRGRPTDPALIEIDDEVFGERAAERVLEAVRERQAAARHFREQIFVYVHGYNNSFKASAQRAAMLVLDMALDCPACVFSWPSRTGLAGYIADRDEADDGVKDFVEQLEAMAERLPGSTVHIVAHSTGCQLVLRAIEVLSCDPKRAPTRVKIGEVVFAHADVGAARLRRVMEEKANLEFRLTSYFSRTDLAMLASDLLRLESTRVGRQPVNIPGVECIDISALGRLFGLNHDVYATSTVVVEDLKRLLRERKKAPEERTHAFKKVKDEKVGTYWVWSRG
jgi:esterase/lipase superfamily enzyme